MYHNLHYMPHILNFTCKALKKDCSSISVIVALIEMLMFARQHNRFITPRDHGYSTCESHQQGKNIFKGRIESIREVNV